MEVYVKKEEELVPLNSGVDLFESMNTHSGDEQSVELVLVKTDKEIYKNLMVELSLLDKDIEFPLKRDANNSNDVFYIRSTTDKTLKFNLKIKNDDNEFDPIKPDSNGLFLVSRNWNSKNEIELIANCIVDEGFSEKFGEITSLGLRMTWYGEVNEKKSFT